VDSEPFFTEIESAVRAIEKISSSIRDVERTTAIARARGLQTAGEIAAYTADELKVLCNLGNKSVRELAEELPALAIPFSASE
jgi:hypothetical protein